jgi:hypothetical protein
MALVPAPAYEASLERFTALRAQNAQTEALIAYETQKHTLYAKTIDSLEAEKRSGETRFEGIERMLGSMLTQTSQLKEDIKTGEHFTTCFTMRSLVDQQDEDTDFHRDAARRDEEAERLERRTQDVHAKLHALGEARTLRALRRELECGERPLAQYVAATGAVLELVGQLRSVQAAAAAEHLPPLRQQLEPLAEALHGAARAHLAHDDDGLRLADHACAALGELRTLPVAPPLLARAYAEAQAEASAERAGGEARADETLAGPSGAALPHDEHAMAPPPPSEQDPAALEEPLERPSVRRRLV